MLNAKYAANARYIICKYSLAAFRKVTACMLSRIIITTPSGDIRKRFVTVTSGLDPSDVEFIPRKSVAGAHANYYYLNEGKKESIGTVCA